MEWNGEENSLFDLSEWISIYIKAWMVLKCPVGRMLNV